MNGNVKNKYGLRNGKIDPNLKAGDETEFKEKVEEGRRFVEMLGGPENLEEILRRCDTEGEVNVEEFLKEKSFQKS
jgi:hypothetical protein